MHVPRLYIYGCSSLLSCFLAGLGGRRAQLAAEAAIDAQHGVSRHEGATEAEQARSFSAAAQAGGVGGYLDDNALRGDVDALRWVHYRYHEAVIKRNGQTVPKKSVLSGRWYGGDARGRAGRGGAAGSVGMEGAGSAGDVTPGDEGRETSCWRRSRRRARTTGVGTGGAERAPSGPGQIVSPALV